MFEGLLIYEIVLLLCGIGLMAVLVGILIHHVRKEQKYGGLLGFFLLPIVMIGYPGIAKIQYEEGKLSIEKYAEQVKQNPRDTEARDKLQAAVNRVENRAEKLPSNPNTLALLAEGNLALGNLQMAEQQATEAVKIKPELKEASRLIETIRVRQIDRLIPSGQQTLTNPEQRLELSNALNDLSQRPELSSEARRALMRGVDALGLTNQARSNLLDMRVLQTNQIVTPQFDRQLRLQDFEP